VAEQQENDHVSPFSRLIDSRVFDGFATWFGSEPGIELVFDDRGEPGSLSSAMQVADAEVLLHNVSNFGDGLVAMDFQLGELSGGGVLAHDAIFNLIEGEEVPVGLTGVSLVGIDLFDLLFCMTTESGAIGEEVGIVHRSWRKRGGQHKAVFSIHRGMLFEAKVRDVVFNGPIGIQVPGELQRLAGFIAVSFFSLAVFTLLFQLILAQRPSGGLYQTGIHKVLKDSRLVIWFSSSGSD
jgi:hypothetical protein